MITLSTPVRGKAAILVVFVLACSPLGCVAPSDSESDDAASRPNAASAQAPDEKQLAAQGYVRTPSGLYHQSCVHKLQDDDTVEQDSRTIIHADGKVDHVDLCTHPIYRSQGTTAVTLPDDTADVDAEGLVVTGDEGPDATTNGYKELGSFVAGNAIREIRAEWTVPAAPNRVSGQTIFLFPGMEPVTGTRILQPVLQFGASAAGGGNHWGIASWSCGNPCFHSGVKKSAAGHSIKGIVAGSQCSNGSCNQWAIGTYDVTNGNATMLVTHKDPHHYRWAFGGALEVYGVSRCSEYPDASATRLHDIGVFNMSLDPMKTAWGRSISSATPNGCGFGITWSNTNHWVKLSY